MATTLETQRAALDTVQALSAQGKGPGDAEWDTARNAWDLALADHYDALAEQQPYRAGRLHADANSLRYGVASRTGSALERTIILPDKDNAGVSLRGERSDIETALLGIAGGFTTDRVSGAWADGGKVYRDKSTRYTLAVTPEQDQAIAARLPEWASLLRQLALYTSVRPVSVSFVEPLQPAHVA